MIARGTNSRSKTQLAQDIENMGARYSAHSDREFNRFGLQVFSGDAQRAVSARNTILYSFAGLIVAIMAQAIIAFALSRVK